MGKKIGVNFPEGELHLYGDINWSTEPWIITLGKTYISQMGLSL